MTDMKTAVAKIILDTQDEKNEMEFSDYFIYVTDKVIKRLHIKEVTALFLISTILTENK